MARCLRCLYVTIWCKKVVIDVGGGFGPPECHSVLGGSDTPLEFLEIVLDLPHYDIPEADEMEYARKFNLGEDISALVFRLAVPHVDIPGIHLIF